MKKIKNKYLYQHLSFFFLLLVVVFSCFSWGCSTKAKLTPVVDKEYYPMALSLINQAQHSIHIIMLVMSSGYGVDDLKKALVEARKRGVEVEVLLNDDVRANRDTLTHLLREGIGARLDDEAKFTHNKLLIVDEKKVLVGATNWTTSSLFYNKEANILIESKLIGEYFENYFAALCQNSYKDPEIPLLSTPRVLPLVNREYSLYLAQLLKNGKKSIHIVMYEMYSPEIPKLLENLVDAQKKGLEVKVLLEKRWGDASRGLNYNNRLTAQYLTKHGIEVRFDSEDIITHAKLVIVDDTSVIGSSNWWEDIDTCNNSSVGIKDPEITAYFENYFQSLWKQGSPF